MVYGPKEVKRETARPPDARVILGWRPGELFPFPFFLPKGMGWGPGTFSFILPGVTGTRLGEGFGWSVFRASVLCFSESRRDGMFLAIRPPFHF